MQLALILPLDLYSQLSSINDSISLQFVFTMFATLPMHISNLVSKPIYLVR